MTSPFSSPGRGRGYRLVTRTLVTAATAAAFVGLASVSASAAPNDTDTGDVTANVAIDSTIELALDDAAFTIDALPDATTTVADAVSGTVTTNSAAGYSVGVQAAAALLVPTVNVQVGSVISLTGLPAGFTLSGVPGATVTTGDTPVTMNVLTNNPGGYSVSVLAAQATLTPADTVANPDSIPIGALSVKETGVGNYVPVSSAAAVTVHTQDARSVAVPGDTISNDYQVVIPNVAQDTYSVALNYIAAAVA
jgi:hypothetical protein